MKTKRLKAGADPDLQQSVIYVHMNKKLQLSRPYS